MTAAGEATEAAAREYEAAREATALLDPPARALLAVTGPTRVKFLHNLVSNDLASRKPGQGVRAALMDVKGRLLVLLRALVTEDAVLLEMPADRLDAIEALLVHYRVAAPVRFARRAVAVLGLVGPGAADTLTRAGAALPATRAPEDHATASLGLAEVRVVRAGDMPAEGWVIHARPEDEGAVRARLVAAGALPIGEDVLDVLRVEDGRPWFGLDVGEDNLLHETGLVGEYHSPAKGCYVGQEVVARLEARGANVNKLLRGLRLSSPAARGAIVRAEGRDVGRITTAGVSPRLGPVAMGFVHRSSAEAGSTVEVDGASAVVTLLPFAR